MKVTELQEAVANPVMKLRFEVSKLRTQVEQQDQYINELLIDMGSLKKTLATLIKKLGPKE